VKSAKNLDSLRSLATRYAEKSWARFRVGEVKFKKSTLSPEGPVYEDLASVPLKN
jgi:2'-5' RNA ligase